MLVRSLAALILLCPVWAAGHALTPHKVNVRTVDDTTQVRMTASNQFDKPATFEVTAYEDAEGKRPMKDFRASPRKFMIPPHSKRTFMARFNVPVGMDNMWVCTKRIPSLRETHVMPTEVCSIIVVKYRSYRQ